MALVFLLILWVELLVLHEYAHARMAYAGGDRTVAANGYLTLNPLRFMHPVLTIVIPLVALFVGGVPLPGGCVYVDTTRLRGRKWDSLVAAAGVAAQTAALPLVLAPFWLMHADPNSVFWTTYSLFVFLLIYTIILNLFPIPPLDGYGILAPYLPRSVRDIGDLVRPWGLFLVFFMVWNSPYLSMIAWRITEFLGVDGMLIARGWEDLRLL